MKKKAHLANIPSVERVSSLAGYHIKVNPVLLDNLFVLPSSPTKSEHALQQRRDCEHCKFKESVGETESFHHKL